MVWSYFGSGHGKGVHHGVGVVLKQELKQNQMRMDGERLQSVVNVVAFCE
jgi:hypothetical protein